MGRRAVTEGDNGHAEWEFHDTRLPTAGNGSLSLTVLLSLLSQPLRAPDVVSGGWVERRTPLFPLATLSA